MLLKLWSAGAPPYLDHARVGCHHELVVVHAVGVFGGWAPAHLDGRARQVKGGASSQKPTRVQVESAFDPFHKSKFEKPGGFQANQVVSSQGRC